jgi:hypothetical protein
MVGSEPAIVILRDTLSVAPALLVTVRFTVRVPAVVYWCVGFRRVEVVPSPKFQNQELIVPSGSVEASVKDMVSAVAGEAGKYAKDAIGTFAAIGALVAYLRSRLVQS